MCRGYDMIHATYCRKRLRQSQKFRSPLKCAADTHAATLHREKCFSFFGFNKFRWNRKNLIIGLVQPD